MNKPILSLSLAAALALAGAGCSSANYNDTPAYGTYGTYREPSNTAKGAAAGAAAGAALGAIVGHQSNETGNGAVVGAAVGGITGAAIGHRADSREAARTEAAYTAQTVPLSPTSQPYETMPPQPSRDAVWIRGHYEYTGRKYEWVAGRWEVPPRGMRTWSEPTWQPNAGGGYVYTRGHWN